MRTSLRTPSLRTPGLLAVLAVLTITVGCAPSADRDPVFEDPDVPRAQATSSYDQELAVGLNEVGYDLFRVLAARDEADIVLSPYSIGSAFGMLDVGATGDLAEVLEELFAYPVDGEDRWSAFNTLDQHVIAEAPLEPLDEFDAIPPIVRVSNREYPAKGFETVDGYAENLARWFGAGVEPLDYQADAEGSRKHINEWVSDRTEGLIPNLLPAGMVTPETQLVLVNTLYLKAQWAQPFQPKATEDADFALPDGSTVTVPMMHQTGLRAMALRGDGYHAVELRYAGDLSMLIIAPDSAHYDEVEAQIGTEFVAGIDAAMLDTSVDLYLPRFESETSFDLREALETGLGVTGLFGVSGLEGIAPGLMLDSAVHAAKIVTDEQGTEAAAATALGTVVSAPSESMTIRVDHPFLYVIRDGDTGAVLFVGRVTDPRA